MPRLWLIFGLAYILISALIFLHHFMSFDGMWRWEEALHHEAFFIATMWAASVYLFVAGVEHFRNRKSRTE